MPVDDGGQVAGPFARDLAHDVLGDRREGDGLVHREQREPVARARLDDVVGDGPELRLAGRERGHAGRREDADERFGVRRVTAPRESGEDQLATGEVAAGVPQVRGHHTAHGAVQFVLAAEQPEAQRVCIK